MDTAVDQGGMSRYWASQTGLSRTAAAPTSFAWRQPQLGLTSGQPPAEGLLATFDTILKNMVSAPAPNAAPAPPAVDQSSEFRPSSVQSSSRSETSEDNGAAKESSPQATADAASQDDSSSPTQEAPSEQGIVVEVAREEPIAVVDQEALAETSATVAEKVSEDDQVAAAPQDPETQLLPSGANFSELDQSSSDDPVGQPTKPLVEVASIDAEPRSQRWTDRERAEIPESENVLETPDASLAVSLVQQQQQHTIATAESLPQTENSDAALEQEQAQSSELFGLQPSVTGRMRKNSERSAQDQASSTVPRGVPHDATETSSVVAPVIQSEEQSRPIAEEDSLHTTRQEGPLLESWNGQEPSEGKVQRRRRSDRGGERGPEGRGAARREEASPLDHLLRGMEPVAPHPLTSEMHRFQVAPAEPLNPSALGMQGGMPPFPGAPQSAAPPASNPTATTSGAGSSSLLSTAAVEPVGAAPVSFGETGGRTAMRDNSTTAPSPTQAPPSSDNGDRVRLIQRVARALQKLGNDGGQIHMMLHPAHLGSVRLDLSVQGKIMEATLSTQTEEALETLRENLGGLRERLQEFGMEVERLELRLEKSESSSAAHTATSDQRQSLWQEMGDQGSSQRRGERKSPDATKTAVSPRIAAARGIASSPGPHSKGLDLML